jgi:hypothetical protein
MAGLYGGFAGRGLTDFRMTAPGALKLFPPVGDPLYAIRRYLCLSPRRLPGGPTSAPFLEGHFVPLIVGETLIISEPWEDAPTNFSLVIFEPYQRSYTEQFEYLELWSETESTTLEWIEHWEYSNGFSDTLEWIEHWEYSNGFSDDQQWLEHWEYSLGFSETQDWIEHWEYSLILSSNTQEWLEEWEYSLSLDSNTQAWLEQWEYSLTFSTSEEWTEEWES